MKGFSIKTEIEEYDTFEQFAKEAQLGEKDLVLCGEHTYKQYVEPLSLGVPVRRIDHCKRDWHRVRAVRGGHLVSAMPAGCAAG